jgi:hypothetical protein
MREVKTVLDDGVRFALVDRLPMDELTEHQANALYWIEPNETAPGCAFASLSTSAKLL